MDHLSDWIFGIVSSILLTLIGVIYKIQDTRIESKASREHCEDLHRVVDRRLAEIGARFDKVDEKQDKQLVALAEIQGKLDAMGVIKK